MRKKGEGGRRTGEGGRPSESVFSLQSAICIFRFAFCVLPSPPAFIHRKDRELRWLVSAIPPITRRKQTTDCTDATDVERMISFFIRVLRVIRGSCSLFFFHFPSFPISLPKGFYQRAGLFGDGGPASGPILGNHAQPALQPSSYRLALAVPEQVLATPPERCGRRKEW